MNYNEELVDKNDKQTYSVFLSRMLLLLLLLLCVVVCSGRVSQVADVQAHWGPAICKRGLFKCEIPAAQNSSEGYHSQTIAIISSLTNNLSLIFSSQLS